MDRYRRLAGETSHLTWERVIALGALGSPPSISVFYEKKKSIVFLSKFRRFLACRRFRFAPGAGAIHDLDLPWSAA